MGTILIFWKNIFNKNILNTRFPKRDPAQYDAWVAVCSQKRKINKSSKVCSKHFDEDDYEPGRKKLKLSAIPKLRRQNEGIPVVKSTFIIYYT